MAELIADIRQAGTVLNQVRRKGVPEVVDAKLAQARLFYRRQEVARVEVSGIQGGASLGGEHQIVRNAAAPLEEGVEHPLVPQFQEYPAKLA